MSKEEKFAEGIPLANIALGIIKDEVTGNIYKFDTAQEATAKPHVSKGKEDILRVKNRIIAQNETEDIVLGYDIDLKDCTFSPEIFAIIDGGQATKDGGYEGQEMGVVCNRHPYTLELYTEEKDYDSSTLRYIKFQFKHCKGQPVEFKLEDGKFYVPTYKARSKPKRHEKPIYLSPCDTLPDTTDIKPTLPGPAPKPDQDMTNVLKVKGDSVELSNKDVNVKVTSNIKWTFTKEIDQDEVTAKNFFVTNKKDGKTVDGNVTIDGDKKVVTFVPESVEKGATYTAEARPIKLLDKSGVTTAIKVEFTTI